MIIEYAYVKNRLPVALKDVLLQPTKSCRLSVCDTYRNLRCLEYSRITKYSVLQTADFRLKVYNYKNTRNYTCINCLKCNWRLEITKCEQLLVGKSSTPTTSVKNANYSTTSQRANEFVEDNTTEKKQASTTPVLSKPEDRHRRSTPSSNKNDGPVMHDRAPNQTTSTKRLTQTKTSSTAAKTTTTVTPKSSIFTVGSHSASASKNGRTPLLANTTQVVAGDLRKTTSDKVDRPVTNRSDKSDGKPQLVQSATAAKHKSLNSVRIIIRVTRSQYDDTMWWCTTCPQQKAQLLQRNHDI